MDLTLEQVRKAALVTISAAPHDYQEMLDALGIVQNGSLVIPGAYASLAPAPATTPRLALVTTGQQV